MAKTVLTAGAVEARRSESLMNDLPRQANGRSWLGLSLMQVRTLLLGGQPWVFRSDCGDRSGIVAYGVLRRGRASASLGLTLIKEIPEPGPFWDGLERVVSRLRVSNFWTEALGDPRPVIPSLTGEKTRYTDQEMFVVDLSRENLFAGFSSNHRRNVRKAAKSGVRLLSLPLEEAMSSHLTLIRSSLSRRLRRGERSWKNTNLERISTLVGGGHGALYQAGRDRCVLSSKLVLDVGDSAFYESGGTSPDGMRIGASQLLMSEIIRDLAARRFETLNLGMVPGEDAGLRRFKQGFAADPIKVDRVHAEIGTGWTRTVNASMYVYRALGAKLGWGSGRSTRR